MSLNDYLNLGFRKSFLSDYVLDQIHKATVLFLTGHTLLPLLCLVLSGGTTGHAFWVIWMLRKKSIF